MKTAIPYGRHNVTQDDIDAVTEVLKSDFLTQGPKIAEFEKKFADYIGVKYAVAVSNATAGLHLSVLALDLKKGDRVITTPISFAATANCVRYCDGEVWFGDIDEDTYLLSLESTRKLIESKPKGFFKGIIPVDFAGLPIDMEEFKNLADQHNLWLIEDACHAPGGYYLDSERKKQMCGNCKYADIGVFSFHPVKHIACGEGGMITTNNEEIYNRLLLLRTHGITKTDLSKNDGGWFYEMKALGYNYRLSELHSVLGITQLLKNKSGVIRRNEIAIRYKKAFEGILKFQNLPKDYYNAHHLFVVETKERNNLYEFLAVRNILAQIHYIPIHTMPYYNEIGYGMAELNNSEEYYKRCISLPMYPSLTNEEQDYVIDNVIRFLNG